MGLCLLQVAHQVGSGREPSTPLWDSLSSLGPSAPSPCRAEPSLAPGVSFTPGLPASRPLSSLELSAYSANHCPRSSHRSPSSLTSTPAKGIGTAYQGELGCVEAEGLWPRCLERQSQDWPWAVQCQVQDFEIRLGSRLGRGPSGIQPHRPPPGPADVAMLRKLQARPLGAQCHPALLPRVLQRGLFPAPASASAASSSFNMLSSFWRFQPGGPTQKPACSPAGNY